MARLIEVQPPAVTAGCLVVAVGDVLWCHATGARISSAGPQQEPAAHPALLVLGPFVPAVVGTGGEIISPAGPPTTVLLLATSPGVAAVTWFVGDPWRQPETVTTEIVVTVATAPPASAPG